MSLLDTLGQKHLPTPAVTTPSATGDTAERLRAYVARMEPAISGQGGHRATFNVARKAADFGLAEHEILAVLREYNQRCEPPWSEAELRHKASEGYSKREPRPVEDRPCEHRSTPRASADSTQPAEWPELVPLDDASQLPSWPTHVLPEPLREMVEAVSVATQTPPEMAALLGIAVLAAVTHPDTEIEVKQGWREAVAVWAAVAMPPAERKSAVLQLMTDPLKNLEKDRAIAARKTQITHDAKTKILKSQLRKLEKACEIEAAQTAALDLANHEDERPVSPRYYVDDCTPEQLAHVMKEQGGRCAVLTAEAGIFGLLAGRYQTAPNLDLYLKGHAGESVRIDRRSHDPIMIERAVLSMGLAIQTSVIEGLAGSPEFRGRGLLARFLYSFPVSKVGHREIAPPPVSRETKEKWAKCVRRVSDRPQAVLKLDAQSLASMEQFRAELEPRLGHDGDLNVIGDWAGKLPGAIAKVAGIFALAAGNIVNSVNMSLENQFEISIYLIEHAKHALGLMGLAPEVAGARTLLRWIRRTNQREFSIRDAQRANSKFQKATDLEGPLNVLIERGYIREVQTPDNHATPRRGRPSSQRFEVSPRIDTSTELTEREA